MTDDTSSLNDEQKKVYDELIKKGRTPKQALAMAKNIGRFNNKKTLIGLDDDEMETKILKGLD